MRVKLSPDQIEVVVPNLKRRLSGVTATIVRLVPFQSRQIGIVTTGPGLSDEPQSLSIWRVLILPKYRTKDHPWRVWHARRNIEMLAGLLLRDLLGKKYKLLFTSASQRAHTAYSRWLISKMDAVIATSEKTATYLEKPSHVIAHGIDIEKFSPATDRAALRQQLGLPEGQLIGCFGRIRAQKGTDIFVEAMMQILPEFPSATAIVLGRATSKHKDFVRKLNAKTKSVGLKKRILFVGEVGVDEMPDWYRALDLFVSPQRWEGFGVATLESMAAGVPVVATRVGAFEQLIEDGQSGKLVEPGNMVAMAEAIKSVLDDEKVHAAFASASRERAVSLFNIETEAENVNAVYTQLLNAKG